MGSIFDSPDPPPAPPPLEIDSSEPDTSVDDLRRRDRERRGLRSLVVPKSSDVSAGLNSGSIEGSGLRI